MKNQLVNDVMIYRDDYKHTAFKTVINWFKKLWNDVNQIINISENNWMKIRIKSDIKSFVIHVYSLKLKNHVIIDNKFDKLHD